MIPWANFHNGIPYDPPLEVQVPLHAEWLTWVEVGPSMKEMFLESPMLEVAHERQFVTSQQGGNSAAFIEQHTSRMEDCLMQLGGHFCSFAIEDQCQPTSPFGADLIQCWRPDLALSEMPPLSLAQDQPDYLTHDTADQPSSSSSPSVPKSTIPATLMGPQPDMEAEEMSDDASEVLKQSLQLFPRARTSLPIHGARAKRNVRQRKRFESKLSPELISTGQKRGSHFMADQHEENVHIANRRQSLHSYRANFGAGSSGGGLKETSYFEGT